MDGKTAIQYVRYRDTEGDIGRIRRQQKFMRAVLEKAREHVQTVMPGYTHLQHAEPVTLGHFLVAFHDVLERDVRRVQAAFCSANQNALGASALAGSSFTLDRVRTAELLGFDGVVENSYDAVAARDYLVEAVAALAVMASSITETATSPPLST